MLIPSRGRPENAERAAASVRAHAGLEWTEAVVVCDDDEADLYRRTLHRDTSLFVAPRLGTMNAALNFAATTFADDCEFIGFMGDDHLVKTANFDYEMLNAIGDRAGIAYGNDLFQGENLPTAVVLSTDIVSTLGFFAPPELKHLFMDNFWLAIGHGLENVNYLPDVIIEHLHYINGKAEHDERYAAVNTAATHNHDEQVFATYVRKQLRNDLEKIRDAHSDYWA